MAFAADLQGVSHRYGKVLALDNVSVQIPAGCMAGLIGPDGVGKSTLLALVAGVRRLQTGQITALGANMADADARRDMAPRIAYMPQGLGRNLYPTLSVRENLDFFGRLFGQTQTERNARIRMLTEATGLAPFPDRPAGKLSGGMKQKLALCCALIHDPELLILDEPTTGVDPLSRRQFWDLIASIRARMPDMSVITATAYMDEAEEFDWLAAMDGGKVIATGAPADMIAHAGARTLDEAFIDLLPEAERAAHQPVILRPRTTTEDKVPAIEAHNLTMRFGKFTAVDNVSFEIPEGEIFGFLGSNGCGKSTTMKMLTGLLTPTEGSTKLFGEPLSNSDMQARLRIGYMSQSFSLYSELTVEQNLALHARLYQIPPERRTARVAEVLHDFELTEVANALPDALPLGIRQRLQLAVATIHDPRILILDEPTSGVDPVARDSFWRTLISLSRDKGVTIFISTHFMNEAARCDRISLMHAGRVLAVGTPQELTEKRGAKTLEEAFIAYLQDETGPGDNTDTAALGTGKTLPMSAPRRAATRLWAYTWREALELIRDPIRLFFALAGPVILMLTIGFGISFDVNRLSFAVFDQDKTVISQRITDQFTSIRQFGEQAPITSQQDLDQRMRSGDLTIALEIPNGFGRTLEQGRQPEASLWFDGAMPFRAQTAQAYALGVLTQFQAQTLEEQGKVTSPVAIDSRYRFNQAFKSANAMVPSILMMILLLIPAVMAAIGVVREVESGTIANFRSTPITRFEFLIGKQLPYIAISWLGFWVLYAMGRVVFQVPFTGSLIMLAAASLIYVIVTTGLGQLISTFTSSQVAAVFATAVITIIPAMNFSGLIVPVSSLPAVPHTIGLLFPGAWFQHISVGAFVKGYGWGQAANSVLMLVGFGTVYLFAAITFLRKQEA